jgi:hypothetical protein
MGRCGQCWANSSLVTWQSAHNVLYQERLRMIYDLLLQRSDTREMICKNRWLEEDQLIRQR